MNEEIDMCCVCGFPADLCNLVRFTFQDNPNGCVILNGYTCMKVVVAKNPKPNDSLICEDCIRGIKQVPFSDFATEDIAF